MIGKAFRGVSHDPVVTDTIIMGFFGTGSRAYLLTVPTNIFISLNFHNNAKHTNDLFFNFTLRFEDILDGEQPCTALSQLLEVGGCWKHGARIRRDSAGAL
jgi:hypothetical protein